MFLLSWPFGAGLWSGIDSRTPVACLGVEWQKEVPLLYKGHNLKQSFRLNLLVEDSVLVELKAVSEPNPIFKSQLLSYLRLADRKLGLLINFEQPKLVMASLVS